MTDETITNGWMKLYHPSGTQVTLPVTLMGSTVTEQMAHAFSVVQTALTVGFSVNMPGTTEGELVEDVAMVARRAGNDGTPILAFYVEHPKMLKKFIHTYLDTAEEITAFESATGLALNRIPVFESDKDITKDHKQAERYIVTLPHPIKVVYKITDRWKQWDAAGGNGQQPQKYELLRYMSGNGAPVAQVPATQPAGDDPATLAKEAAYRDAGEVVATNGAKLSTMSTDLLTRLANSKATGVTDEMKKAAKIRLEGMK